MRRSTLSVWLFALTALGCTDDQAPEEAQALWDLVHAENYREWARPAAFPARTPSDTVHSDAVDIFINDVIVDAIERGEPLEAFPVGSIIVKDGYQDDGDHDLVAIMERRETGWFWAEFLDPVDSPGDSQFSGEPGVCINCHNDAPRDQVFTVALP
ncbi:MAG: cytochrome P460 family protein [Myxococcota bacterium]